MNVGKRPSGWITSVIKRPGSSGADNPDVYRKIKVSPLQAEVGCSRIITCWQGLKRKRLLVKIPPYMRQGMRIRLRGMGKIIRGKKGDLYLYIDIRTPLTLRYRWLSWLRR
ncbi:MAG: hypothetical protein JXA46_18465 [Dehalococcoidales bacterium]|nr:hypothetical protein [Dehalococcoidales bacterium]